MYKENTMKNILAALLLSALLSSCTSLSLAQVALVNMAIDKAIEQEEEAN